MRAMAVVMGILILLALFLGISWFYRADLVEQRDAVADAWARVQTELQRRAELVPSLIESLSEAERSNRKILDSATQARAKLLNARNPQEAIVANQYLDNAIGRLLVAAHTRSDLRASRALQRIQDELAVTENRIAVERRKYNEALQKYNTSIAMFPNNFAATLFGFERNEAYFRTDPVLRPAPASL